MNFDLAFSSKCWIVICLCFSLEKWLHDRWR